MRYLIIFFLTGCGFRNDNGMEMERLSKDVLESKNNQGLSIEIMKLPLGENK